MSSIFGYQLLINQGSFILISPPAGKPDSTIPCDPFNLETRKRVKQLEQKDTTCWYYALGILRDRIGKKPSQEFMQARKIEILGSTRRKSISQLTQEFRDRRRIINDYSFGRDMIKTREKAQALLDSVNRLEKKNEQSGAIADPEVVKEKQLLCSLLTNFCQQSQTNDINEFVIQSYHLGKKKANIQFLNQIDVNPKKFYEEHFLNKECYLGTGLKSWNNLNEEELSLVLDNMAFIVSYQNYHFTESAWKPHMPIEDLIQQIKEHGPHVIMGYFGKETYKEGLSLFKQQTTRHPIYYWKPNSKRNTVSGVGCFHAVVVIGACKEKGRELVYFVDPMDSSDPHKQEDRPIYVISYQRLRTDIANLDGLKKGLKTTQEPTFFSETAYAVYKNRSVKEK